MGTCIALSCNIGPLVFAGMGAPSDSITALRSALYGYDGHELEATIDCSSLCRIGKCFLSNGGGASIDNQLSSGGQQNRLKEVTKQPFALQLDFGNPTTP